MNIEYEFRSHYKIFLQITNLASHGTKKESSNMTFHSKLGLLLHMAHKFIVISIIKFGFR